MGKSINRCKFCNKITKDYIVCCLWSFYEKNYKVNTEGFKHWYDNNKEEIEALMKECESRRADESESQRAVNTESLQAVNT